MEQLQAQAAEVRRPTTRLASIEGPARQRSPRGALGTPDRDLCFVADVRLGERIGPAADHAVRLRDIRGACRQIAGLWPGIQAKPSL